MHSKKKKKPEGEALLVKKITCGWERTRDKL
jgi:hypothetical protein